MIENADNIFHVKIVDTRVQRARHWFHPIGVSSAQKQSMEYWSDGIMGDV